MVKKTLGMGLVLSTCLAVTGCNGFLDAGEPTVTQPEDTDPPEMTTTGGAGGAGGTGSGSTCGDGAMQQGEQCDDGNDDPNDGCDACVRACGFNPEFRDDDSGHCYRLEPGPDTWDEAAQTCAPFGGALASVETNDELAFVQNRITVDTWVGARTTQAGASTFKWLSGEPAMFDPDLEGEGDCVKISGEFLNFMKEPCNTPLSVVCERATALP